MLVRRCAACQHGCKSKSVIRRKGSVRNLPWRSVVVCGHNIGWDGATVLGTEQAWRRRKVKEAFHIARESNKHPLMNKNSGWGMNNIWKQVIKQY